MRLWIIRGVWVVSCLAVGAAITFVYYFGW